MFSIPWADTVQPTRPRSQRRHRRERNAQRPITACHTIRPVQDMSRGLSQGGQDPWFVCVCVWFYVPHVARGAWQEPEAAESDGGEREKAGRRRSDTVWPWFQVLIHLNTRISAGSTPNMSTCKKKLKHIFLSTSVFGTQTAIFLKLSHLSVPTLGLNSKKHTKKLKKNIFLGPLLKRFVFNWQNNIFYLCIPD